MKDRVGEGKVVCVGGDDDERAERREKMGSGQHTGEFFRRRDEWRKHPMLTNQLRHATPGLGIALVAFGIYLVGEQVYNRIKAPSSHSHSTSASHAQPH